MFIMASLAGCSLCQNAPAQNDAKIIAVNASIKSGKINFGIQEATRNLRRDGWQVLLDAPSANAILVKLDQKLEIGNESFRISPTTEHEGTTVVVEASDDAGAMYGLMEAAELIVEKGIGNVPAKQQQPYMEMRGVKFNIPLDVRSPSYSDGGESAQKNIPTMWSWDFWQNFIDECARNRYNMISLWNELPFPSMVKVPEYPDVSLDDVKRSTGVLSEYYHAWGIEFGHPEFTEQNETLIKMTIDEKIAFWRRVMAYAKERNISFYIVTWNVFDYGIDGKYGITDDLDNQTTRDYYRCAIRTLFQTYPDLAGLGLTVGENMVLKDPPRCEEWAWDTYGRGMLMAAEACPGRKMTFIHRQHGSGAEGILKHFGGLRNHPTINFIFSFKYAAAHVYNATIQNYHTHFVNSLDGMKTIWTLRNDDIFQFRWHSPEFVREFIKNIPIEPSAGFYYGSDNYIWGLEFMEKEPQTPRQLDIIKHRYQWMLWGRLGYDLTMPEARFKALMRLDFPDLPTDKLYEAWTGASMIYPVTSAYHYGSLDFMWYIEGCICVTLLPKSLTFRERQNLLASYSVMPTGLL